MSMPQSWSSVLAAAVLGSFCSLAAAQGLRADEDVRSPWSFEFSGFAHDGEHMSWRGSRWLTVYGSTGMPPRLGELAPRWGAAQTAGPGAGVGYGRLAGLPAGNSGAGVAGTARYALPLARLQVFGGGGAGLYRSALHSGLHETGGGGDLGLHAVAGVALPLADDTEVGVSLRRVWIQREGGAGEEGGSFLFLGLRLTR